MKKKFNIFVVLTLIISVFLMPNFALANDEEYNFGYLPSPAVGIPNSLPDVYQSYGLPAAVDLSQYVGPIKDQESDPWCVAYGVTTAVEAQMRLQGMAVPEGGFSIAWLYARCKQLDGVPSVRGTYIFTALEIAKNEGLCPESLCPTPPYKNQKDENLPKLTPAMAEAAAQYKIESYKRLLDPLGYADMQETKAALAAGHFVILASYVEQSWNKEYKGWLLEPWGYIRGGHCVVLDGYDDTQVYSDYTGFFDGPNSWGDWWGQSGYFEMSYNYANWRDLSVGMPMVLEAYTIDLMGQDPQVNFVEMPIPLQIINPGYTVLPFRVVFEALGGTVDWGFNSQGKIWVRGTVELKYETVTLEMVQGDPQLKVIHNLN